MSCLHYFIQGVCSLPERTQKDYFFVRAPLELWTWRCNGYESLLPLH